MNGKIMLLLLVALFLGCRPATEPRITKEPAVDVNSLEFIATISLIIHNRAGENWGKKEYQAEVEYWKMVKETCCLSEEEEHLR